MDWKQLARERLPRHLDAVGDLPPPWEEFPTYERYTIGWRMGAGEDWLALWAVFLEGVGPAEEARLAYLKRHPPAPCSWSDAVYSVLHPRPAGDDDEDDVDDERMPARRAELLRLGLIESDVAYATWLRRQVGVRWPWTDGDRPENAARYGTRGLWFWSRQVAVLRRAGALVVPAAPPSWTPCVEALRTGVATGLDLRRGLLSLAIVLCAGEVAPPWRLGLRPAEAEDSFELDMGYVDAFRLWCMSALDDDEQVQALLRRAPPPAAWSAWVAANMTAG